MQDLGQSIFYPISIKKKNNPHIIVTPMFFLTVFHTFILPSRSYYHRKLFCSLWPYLQ
jgi:hypothetical protein